MTKLFGNVPLDQMNESDVEQVILRPLLHALGYRQGTEANIRTQISLKYEKAFLGHRNEARDPVLRGKPDFVCEVVPFARWVSEAKSPAHELVLDDSQQAHTYATHPEIAAEFYLLTNGREFRLYRTGRPDAPLMTWMFREIDDVLPALKNLLGPEAMKKRAQVPIDLGKPLAEGIASRVELVGGEVIYEHHTSSDFPINTTLLDGLRNHVSGIEVKRTPEGLIISVIKLESAFSVMDAVHEAIGLKTFEFSTSDEYISRDVNRPSIFQNIRAVTIPTGTSFPAYANSPAVTLPFGVDVVTYTQAFGFLDGDHFKGTFEIDYQFQFQVIGTPFARAIKSKGSMTGDGSFDVRFR